LIAPMIAVVLTPPMADTNARRPSEPCISRRTSWKKDIRLRRPLYSSRILDASGRPPAASGATDQIVLSRQFGAPGHFSATRWSGDEQQKQRQQRRDGQGQKERTGKSHPALAAAETNEETEDQVRCQARKR
jgi:hypothetical protein